MEISEIRSKAEELEKNIWDLVYQFEKETSVAVTDISISRINSISARSSSFYQVNVEIKLW